MKLVAESEQQYAQMNLAQTFSIIVGLRRGKLEMPRNLEEEFKDYEHDRV